MCCVGSLVIIGCIIRLYELLSGETTAMGIFGWSALLTFFLYDIVMTGKGVLDGIWPIAGFVNGTATDTSTWFNINTTNHVDNYYNLGPTFQY